MNNLIDVVFAAALLFSFGKTDGLQNVTVQVGSTAYLHCPVLHLGEREVLILNYNISKYIGPVHVPD